MIMANPLYEFFGVQGNPISQIIKQARELQKTLSVNPRDEVQRLLNSGQMSQQQFNHYSQMAQQIVQSMGNV